MKTLTMENTHTCIKASIKPFKHVTNMSMNTNISLEHVYDARIVVIEFEKRSKSYGCYVTIMGLWKLVIDRASFWEGPGNDW